MKVDDYKKVYENASGKLSDINRYIAFAGIGLIWIFTKTETSQIVPRELTFPAILLVVSLAFDMLQYAYKTIAWYIVFRCKEKEIEKKKINREEWSSEHSTRLNIVTWTCFWIKIILVFLAYIFILKFLIRTIV